MCPLPLKVGSWSGLIGLNGAGKSTTINEIIGLLTPLQWGKLRLTVLPCEKMRPAIASRLAISRKRPQACMRELTLREHIETVAMAYGIEQKWLLIVWNLC